MQGLSNQKVKEEIDDLLTNLELSERSDVLAMNLSGGMKKKLRYIWDLFLLFQKSSSHIKGISPI